MWWLLPSYNGTETLGVLSLDLSFVHRTSSSFPFLLNVYSCTISSFNDRKLAVSVKHNEIVKDEGIEELLPDDWKIKRSSVSRISTVVSDSVY